MVLLSSPFRTWFAGIYFFSLAARYLMCDFRWWWLPSCQYHTPFIWQIVCLRKFKSPSADYWHGFLSTQEHLTWYKNNWYKTYRNTKSHKCVLAIISFHAFIFCGDGLLSEQQKNSTGSVGQWLASFKCSIFLPLSYTYCSCGCVYVYSRAWVEGGVSVLASPIHFTPHWSETCDCGSGLCLFLTPWESTGVRGHMQEAHAQTSARTHARARTHTQLNTLCDL